jgi:hypothetical protein
VPLAEPATAPAAAAVAAPAPVPQAGAADGGGGAKLLVEGLARYSTVADVRRLLARAGCPTQRIKKHPDWTHAYAIYSVRRPTCTEGASACECMCA